jgi:hypothetical protein
MGFAVENLAEKSMRDFLLGVKYVITGKENVGMYRERFGGTVAREG